MRTKRLLIPFLGVLLLFAPQARAANSWLSLQSDHRDVVRKAIVDQLVKQGAFTASQEDGVHWKAIEEEKGREDALYLDQLGKARLSFIRAKHAHDDLAAQATSLATDSEETLRQIKTIHATIENIDQSVGRWGQEMKANQRSLETWLSTEKQEVKLVAAIYKVDAGDRQSAREQQADLASMALLSQHRENCRKALADALGDVVSSDFLRGMTEGVFTESGGKALIFTLAGDAKGATYLRLKRYDFYPFQKPKTAQLPVSGDIPTLSAVVAESFGDLEAFLKKDNYSLSGKILSDAHNQIQGMEQDRQQVRQRLADQIRSLREKNASLQKRIDESRGDREAWSTVLGRQESRHEPLKKESEAVRTKMESAERSLKEAKSALRQRLELQETIIPIREAAFLKKSQTPAEAAAGAIVDKLAEVKDDARAQYARDAHESIDLLAADKKPPLVNTEARIVGMKLLSFMGDGDMVRIKAALRVRLTLAQEAPPERKEALADPLKAMAMELVLVKGGCFPRGDGFDAGKPDEKPVHTVCVDDFYIGKTEVTQGQWQSVMGGNPSFFKSCGEKCPVEQVSWNDIQEFIKKLNGKSGKQYRLPTEAEWEFAARSGGRKEKYAGTSSDAELDAYAWYSGNSGGSTHPVGQKKPNGLGIYDMTGNVWEWCQDWYGEGYYGAQIPRKNPPGPASGTRRVLRGGAWLFEPAGIRASARYSLTPVTRNDLYGFRLALPLSR